MHPQNIDSQIRAEDHETTAAEEGNRRRKKMIFSDQ